MALAEVTNLAQFRSKEHQAILKCALEQCRSEDVEGLLLCVKVRGETEGLYLTGIYARDPDRAVGLVSRIWKHVVEKVTRHLPPVTTRL